MYNVMEDDWPKIPDKEYKEINPSGYYTVNGEIEILDSMGKYYHIDYDKLKPYIDKPDNSERYILRNPKGKVYYIKGDGVLIEENTGDDENNPEETWDNSKEYVQGDIVEYNGRKYRARWYTKNEEPGLMASPWQEITDEWRDFNIYQQGDAVEYNGREYRARWYTKNEEPGGLNGPWEEL